MEKPDKDPTIDDYIALYRAMDEDNILLVDVRTIEEYEAGHIPDGINFPLDKVEGDAIKVLPDKLRKIYLYCRSGNRSGKAADILSALSYQNVTNIGGIINYTGRKVSKKILIIGGAAGGATAAARLRRLNEFAEIIIIEKSGYVSYANCGLPYYIGGKIKDKKSLTLQTPESFKRRFNVEVRVNQEVLSIDRAQKKLTVKRLAEEKGSGETAFTPETYTETYDNLIIATGAYPNIPAIPGIDLAGIFSLRNMEDTFAMDEYIAQRKPLTALIAGAGATGLELAENLTLKGIKVTVLQGAGQILTYFDKDMAAVLHSHLKEKGVDIKLNTRLAAFEECGGEGQGSRLCAITQEGETYPCDMAVMALGVTPQSDLALAAGLEVGVKGAIVTDEHMRTSDEAIYAVGDVVQIKEFVTKQYANIALAGPANKQARVAADNIFAIPSSYKGSQSTSIIKVFDLTAATTGLNFTQAKAASYDCDYAVITSSSHASYYPGAESMTVKAVFERESGKILGAQIIGKEGVDKRIDIIATAIRASMSAYDLTELDLAYAPPYSSAKDPVNMIGYVMENILTGKVSQIHWEDLPDSAEGGVILDVRTPGEYEKGHIEGAINIPLDNLREVLDIKKELIPEGKTLYVHCQSGMRSYIACRILSQRGFDCVNIAGGYGFYAYSKHSR